MTIRALALSALVFTACTKDPEPADLARQKAGELFKKKEFAAAAAEYERSLQLKPEQDLKVWDRAAAAYMEAGDYAKTAELLEKTLDKREPAAKSETLRNIAGMYLQKANNAEQAEKYFQKALELDPKDDQALSWLAEISSIRGGARSQTAVADSTHLTQAIARYDQVIALVPSKPDAYINKRIALVKYLTALNQQKLSIQADAQAQKNDKEAVASMQEQLADTEKRIAELSAVMEETTKKLAEVQKAAKAAAAK